MNRLIALVMVAAFVALYAICGEWLVLPIPVVILCITGLKPIEEEEDDDDYIRKYQKNHPNHHST